MVQGFLKRENINVIYTQNETKANYAERVIRTMRNMMARHFMKQRSYKFTNVLQDLVDSYNTRPQRSIGGSAPSSVTENNADETRLQMYLTRTKTKRRMTKKKQAKRKRSIYKFKRGDNVRISQLKQPFEKDNQQKWTQEFF